MNPKQHAFKGLRHLKVQQVGIFISHMLPKAQAHNYWRRWGFAFYLQTKKKWKQKWKVIPCLEVCRKCRIHSNFTFEVWLPLVALSCSLLSTNFEPLYHQWNLVLCNHPICNYMWLIVICNYVLSFLLLITIHFNLLLLL